MESNTQKEELEIDLGQLFRTLWHKKLIIIVLGIIGLVLGLLFTRFLITPKYESVTKIYIMNKQNENQTTYSDLQTSSILTKDFQVLIVSRPVLEQVIEDMNLSYTAKELEKNIEVTSKADTRILSITVTDNDPVLAKRIADSVREISRDRIVQVMDIEAVNVVEEGSLSEDSVNMNYKRNTILGAFLLMLIGSGVIAVRMILDDSIKTPDDIEKYLGISVLGTIPQSQQQQARSTDKPEENVSEPKKETGKGEKHVKR